MYILTNFGNAKLQSLTIKRISPQPAKLIDATKPWVPNVDPGTDTKKVPEQPKTARVFDDDVVLNGAGSGAEWEVKAKVSASTSALLVITLMHDVSRTVACSFEAAASGGQKTTAARFTE